MNIVIIGGTGLIGRKLSARLEQAGHAVLAAAPSSGVNSVTGEGLDRALAGAEVLIDVTNAPSFEEDAVMAFFRASTGNLLRAGRAAGIRHYVALSVVGSERLPESGYFRAKIAQEALIADGGLPYTIVRATQFFEFLDAIAQSFTRSGAIRAPAALLQPMAADDVAEALARVATEPPLNGMREVAGPAPLRLTDLLRKTRPAQAATKIIQDDDAPYFGDRIDDTTLMPGAQARLGTLSLETWLSTRAAPVR
ncbi:SDR family oxidoreductase [Castellaniella denitrificans]|uniref:NAD(P)H-binding protein n=1 Tax=Castellaniella denitrificans TaxID=56119 RepID=A0ABT4M412_9BURK|nr:NAD(P)H-binding protein [Castellaniella denitrificans]MCZ4330053.1 NAD(P)H-binding protein [Castellaniella denitrificans]